MKELTIEIGFEPKSFYKKTFGSYNNTLKELNLPLNSVYQYDDNFLKNEFERFVKENKRTPNLLDFNNSEYPSFWCYQNRFSSWNKAILSYGYKPTDSNRKYYFDDGEVCDSSYEYDITNWLRNKGLVFKQNYYRKILYRTFIKNYECRRDCDYVINYNNEQWYVEVAGLCTNHKTKSSMEKDYEKRFIIKQKLLEDSNLKYLIIYPHDLKEKSLEDIFYFIN
jgi:hypothetical protein